jgi:hypothetical protein
MLVARVDATIRTELLIWRDATKVKYQRFQSFALKYRVLSAQKTDLEFNVG